MASTLRGMVELLDKHIVSASSDLIIRDLARATCQDLNLPYEGEEPIPNGTAILGDILQQPITHKLLSTVGVNQDTAVDKAVPYAYDRQRIPLLPHINAGVLQDPLGEQMWYLWPDTPASSLYDVAFFAYRYRVHSFVYFTNKLPTQTELSNEDISPRPGAPELAIKLLAWENPFDFCLYNLYWMQVPSITKPGTTEHRVFFRLYVVLPDAPAFDQGPIAGEQNVREYGRRMHHLAMRVKHYCLSLPYCTDEKSTVNLESPTVLRSHPASDHSFSFIRCLSVLRYYDRFFEPVSQKASSPVLILGRLKPTAPVVNMFLEALDSYADQQVGIYRRFPGGQDALIHMLRLHFAFIFWAFGKAKIAALQAGESRPGQKPLFKEAFSLYVDSQHNKSTRERKPRREGIPKNADLPPRTSNTEAGRSADLPLTAGDLTGSHGQETQAVASQLPSLGKRSSNPYIFRGADEGPQDPKPKKSRPNTEYSDLEDDSEDEM